MAKQQSMRIVSDMGESEDREPRNYYLWGYQHYFAIDVKVTAESLFKKLDETIVPVTLIVAIKSKENGSQPAAVVEPEDHEFQPDDFNNVLQLAH